MSRDVQHRGCRVLAPQDKQPKPWFFTPSSVRHCVKLVFHLHTFCWHRSEKVLKEDGHCSGRGSTRGPSPGWRGGSRRARGTGTAGPAGPELAAARTEHPISVPCTHPSQLLTAWFVSLVDGDDLGLFPYCSSLVSIVTKSS